MTGAKKVSLRVAAAEISKRRAPTEADAAVVFGGLGSVVSHFEDLKA